MIKYICFKNLMENQKIIMDDRAIFSNISGKYMNHKKKNFFIVIAKLLRKLIYFVYL